MKTEVQEKPVICVNGHRSLVQEIVGSEVKMRFVPCVRCSALTQVEIGELQKYEDVGPVVLATFVAKIGPFQN